MVEVIGDTKIHVAVHPNGIIAELDEVNFEDSEVSDEEFEDLNPNFMTGDQ